MWEKPLYIAQRINSYTNDYGMYIEEFDKPKKYLFNYQPLSGNTDYQMYGEKINDVYTAYVDMSFLGKVKIGDRAYLIDGETQDINIALNDNEYCKQANYYVKSVLPQNLRIRIDFMKINKKITNE